MSRQQNSVLLWNPFIESLDSILNTDEVFQFFYECTLHNNRFASSSLLLIGYQPVYVEQESDYCHFNSPVPLFNSLGN